MLEVFSFYDLMILSSLYLIKSLSFSDNVSSNILFSRLNGEMLVEFSFSEFLRFVWT